MAFSQPTTSALVSAEQLSKLIDQGNVKVLRAHMAFPVNNAGIVESNQRIREALYFDFENVFADKNSSLPHMLPSEREFSKKMSLLGIYNHDVIVVYDNQGMFSAPRVWWMLKVMGHQQVYVLNGGLKAWLDAGYTTEPLDTPDIVHNSQYQARLSSKLVIDKSTILNNLNTNLLMLFDARGKGRFYAKEPEPRNGVRSGHIPSANHVHYATLIDKGYLLNVASLKRIFEKFGLATQKRWIFSCGSGVTACILALAAHELGVDNWSVYDGSWSEWGADQRLPIATD